MHSTKHVTPLFGNLFLGVALYQIFISPDPVAGNFLVGLLVLQYTFGFLSEVLTYNASPLKHLTGSLFSNQNRLPQYILNLVHPPVNLYLTMQSLVSARVVN